MNPEPLRCFTFHAERLQDDRVWERTRSILETLESTGGRATLFVHPREAIAAGFDLADRIHWLLDRGHEIAQHTHFYAPQPTASRSKPPTSLAPDDVRSVLERDISYLKDKGADPKGFVAGGWAISDTAIEWLQQNGFTYDCSWRGFDLGYRSEHAEPGSGATAPEAVDGVLRLPTTMTLRTAAKRVIRAGPAPSASGYELIYTHDYDLLKASRFLAAAFVVRGWGRRRGRWIKALDLARTFT